MNIGIDSTALIYGRGVSRYTANLIRGLSDLPNTNLHLYGYSGRQRSELTKALKELRLHPTPQTTLDPWPPSLQRWLWQWGLNPVSKKLPQIDVFHAWDWLQPPDEKLPIVTTIHDLALLHFPDTAHPKIANYHRRSWQQLRKNTQTQIIAVSHTTKQDIVDLLEIEPKRVHVVYEALPLETLFTTETLADEEYDQLKHTLNLKKPYILFVGTREPRKNLTRLIQAWQPVAKDVDLLIAGDQGWDQSAELDVVHRPRFLGRVTEPELVVLYEEAELLAYPSLYEGFGLPILEAFYHGTPVVTSNISSLPEVAGTAAELVDPQSVPAITAAIQKILTESNQDRQRRLQQMVLRLQLFDWTKVAAQTKTVYQQAIKAHA